MINYFRYKSTNNFKTFENLNNKLLLDKIIPNRKNINILIIDDEASFLPEKLKQLNYTNVKCISNYTDTSEIDKYQVILCDIENVGKEIHIKKQGFAVYQQLKKLYPNKIICLYTAHNPEDYGELCDDCIVINKPIQTSELVDLLDMYTERFWKPEVAWEYISKTCIDKGATFKYLAILEDMFVRSFNKNTINIYEKVSNKYKKNNTMSEYIGVGLEVLTILLKIAPGFLKI